MSLPRPILPNATYLITRRCTQREFLLKPTPLTCRIFSYCLAYAALRTNVRIHAVCVLSNHWHGVVTDPDGRLPEFMALLHRLVAAAVNASLGRWENLWASEPPSAVRLERLEDIRDKTVYALLNPVAGGLVRRSREWPGLCRFWMHPAERIARPKVFFRADGSMPESVLLELVPPARASDPDALEREVTALVHEGELRARGKIRNVLGVRAVLRQHVTDRPTTAEPRRDLSPRIACKSKWHRIEALLRLKSFLCAYRLAWAAFRDGVRDVVFPAGTYAMRIHGGVLCEPHS